MKTILIIIMTTIISMYATLYIEHYVNSTKQAIYQAGMTNGYKLGFQHGQARAIADLKSKGKIF